MNFISKHISLIGILLLTAFVAVAAGLYFGISVRSQNAQPANIAKQTFACPMHPDVMQDHSGNCTKCGMSLIPATTKPADAEDGCANHASGCCAAPATGVRALPPGHPPVEGYSLSPTPARTNHVH